MTDLVPGEIWLVIGDYLDGEDYHNFRLVSRRIYELTLKDVWGDLEVGMIPFKKNRGIRTERCHGQSWVPVQAHTCGKRFVFLTLNRIEQMKLTVPNYRSLLEQVVNFCFYETENETVRSIASYMTSLRTVSITGRATDATLSLLDTEFSNVPRVFVSGALEHIETLLDYPQLCSRLVNISAFFGIEQDHDTLVRVGRSLTQLESLSLINRVNPRLIHVEDLVYLTQHLTGLKSIQTSGPLENEGNLDWIPESVVEFTVNDDDLSRSEGINLGQGVQRLVLQIGSSGLGHPHFRFPQLEHLEIQMNDEEEEHSADWVQMLVLENTSTLKSVYLSTKDEDSRGLDIFKNTKAFPQLESLVIDVCFFKEVNFGCELDLPKLDYFALHSNVVEAHTSVSACIKGVLNGAPNLDHLYLDKSTCNDLGISITRPVGRQIFDKFNILREFSNPQMYRVERNQII